MKKILFAIGIASSLILATACGNDKLTHEQAAEHQLDDSLRVALADSDSLFALLYDVTVGLEQITTLEHLLNAEINSENVDARRDIEKQMAAIQRGLMERRQRIAELEQRLAKSADENSGLRAKLNALREQIDAQAVVVADLTERLQQANYQIEVLNDSIATLTASVDSISAVEADTKRELDQAVTDLNTVYYVIGSNDELKTHGFLSGGGFLRKTKVLESEFDAEYMTRVDRRTFETLPLDAKKAEVKTQQPKDSYVIEKDEYGMLVLRITDADRFWAVSNILVVETKN